MAFRAEVIDARLWIVRNHRSRADGICDMLISPPLDFESVLIDCSRAMSVKRAVLNDLWYDSLQQTLCRHPGVLVPVAACRRYKQVSNEHNSACS